MSAEIQNSKCIEPVRFILDLKTQELSRPRQLMEMLKSAQGQLVTETLKYQLAELNCEINGSEIDIMLDRFTEQEQDELLFLVEQQNITYGLPCKSPL